MAKKRRGSSKGSRGKSNSVSMDFTDVKDMKFTIPDGTYDVKVVDVQKQESSDKPVALIVFFEVESGKHKGFRFREFMSTSEQALYRIKNFMDACDIEYSSKGKFSIDLNEFLDAEGTVKLKQHEANGYTNMSIVSWVQPSEEDEDEDDDYEDDDYEDDYDDDYEDDDYEEDDEDNLEDDLKELKVAELKAVAKELGIKSTKIKKCKKSKDLIKLIMQEDVEDIEEAIEEL